jgi:DNA modification methylase
VLLRRAQNDASGDLLEALEKRRPGTRQHDNVVIACQDNLGFMRRLQSEIMQLIVTSPPYNIGKVYESRSPLDSCVEAQKNTIAECVRLLRPGGSLCWQVGNHVHKGEIFPPYRANGSSTRRDGVDCLASMI